MLAPDAVRAAPALTGRDPRVTDRHNGTIESPPNTAGHGAAIDAAHHDRAWWRGEARRLGADWPAAVALHVAIIVRFAAAARLSPACDTCGVVPCVNPSYCEACRQADARVRRKPVAPASAARPTPQTTIEAIMHSVRERGLAALREPAIQWRLQRCD